MSRNLLHRTKFNQFKDWLRVKGYEYRNPRGEFELIQIRIPGLNMWACVFDRVNVPEHYTVDRRLDPVVRAFIESTKESQP